jgi:tRNA1(Val) A37 N6-methylase TrmN6
MQNIKNWFKRVGAGIAAEHGIIPLANFEKKINVFYNTDIDIDGFHVREDFYNLIRKYKSKKKYDYACECFCGHGAIGFYIFEKKLCKELVLLDSFKPAVEFCKMSIENNKLSHVTSSVTDALDKMLDTRIDLLIANPPWRDKIASGINRNDYKHQLRKMVDLDWNTHKKFYDNIFKQTTKDVDIFVYEDSRFSQLEDFMPMIKNAKLKVKKVHKNFGIDGKGYVLHLKKALSKAR